MNRKPIVIVAALLLAAAALGVRYWPEPRPVPAAEPVAAGEVAPADAARPPGVPATSAIRHPIDAASAPASPVQAPDDPKALWRQGLEELLGRVAFARFVQTGDFSHHVVATVDNLPRSYAPSRLWPVNPTPGRFAVDGEDGSLAIAPQNAARYTPLVSALTTLDARRTVALYVRMYPQLQKAYEELGYPGRYFNDRVVEAIDDLLATPEPGPPGPRMQLTEVKGSVPSTRPWLRYEFADPVLQASSAGQRILLRVGAEHRQALKAKLAELRSLLARAPAVR